VWSKVANEVLERTGDEARAIRSANAAVNRIREGLTYEVAYTMAIAESMLEERMDEKDWGGALYKRNA
jgi:hypothetical protein